MTLFKTTHLLPVILALLSYKNISAFSPKLESELINQKIMVNNPFKVKISLTLPLNNLEENITKNISHYSSEDFIYLGMEKEFTETVPHINGRNLSFVLQKSFFMLFNPLKEGDFSISFAKLKYNQYELETEKLNIKINSNTNPSKSNLSNHPKLNNLTTLKLYYSISNPNPFVGEYLKLSLKLFPLEAKHYLRDFLDPPSSNDVFLKSFYTYSDSNPKRKITPDGIEAVIEETLIYPLKPGEIEISPRIMRLTLDGISNVLSAESIKLNVKDTTEILSGSFVSETKLSPTEIKIGDIIIYSLIISGSGNLITYELPENLIMEIDNKNLQLLKQNSSFDFTADDLSQSKKSFDLTFKVLGKPFLKTLTLPYFDIPSEKEKTLRFIPSELIFKKSVKATKVPNILKKTYDKLFFIFLPLIIILALIGLTILVLMKKKKTFPKDNPIHSSKNNLDKKINSIFFNINELISKSKLNTDEIYRNINKALALILEQEIEHLSSSSSIEKVNQLNVPEPIKNEIKNLLLRTITIRFSPEIKHIDKPKIVKDYDTLKSLWKALN